MIKIETLSTYTSQDLEDLRELLCSLSDRLELKEENLRQVIEDPHTHLYVIYSETGRIIGCATLCVATTLEGKMGHVEDVVVSPHHRGKHLGRRLMEHLLNEAKQYAPIQLHLTSNPKRIEANKLYQSLQFVQKETNVYQMEIR
ncbi:MAG: GNAT family N-acetyltransferase [Paludibacteraceae bacterium]|nr:GNAT family N-acetyltransferase [Paludibacteraceae bacterium]